MENNKYTINRLFFRLAKFCFKVGLHRAADWCIDVHCRLYMTKMRWTRGGQS